MISARQAFRLATEGGARAAGIEAGRVEPGMLADLALVALDRPHLVPVHDVDQHAGLLCPGRRCGDDDHRRRVVMRDGEVQTVDEEKAMHEAARYGAGLYDEGLRRLARDRSAATS